MCVFICWLCCAKLSGKKKEQRNCFQKSSRPSASKALCAIFVCGFFFVCVKRNRLGSALYLFCWFCYCCCCRESCCIFLFVHFCKKQNKNKATTTKKPKLCEKPTCDVLFSAWFCVWKVPKCPELLPLLVLVFFVCFSVNVVFSKDWTSRIYYNNSNNNYYYDEYDHFHYNKLSTGTETRSMWRFLWVRKKHIDKQQKQNILHLFCCSKVRSVYLFIYFKDKIFAGRFWLNSTGSFLCAFAHLAVAVGLYFFICGGRGSSVTGLPPTPLPTLTFFRTETARLLQAC